MARMHMNLSTNQPAHFDMLWTPTFD